MKKRNSVIFGLITLLIVCVLSCDNPIINKWWVEPEPADELPDVVVKHIPVVTLETIVEKVYETIYVELPPDIIYETIFETKYIYETIIEQLPPEIVYETIYEKEYIYETIYEKLPPEVIYETITVTETVYVDVIVEIEKEVPVYVTLPPDKETIIEWLTNPDNEAEVIEIIKIIKEYIPVEVIVEIIKEMPPKEIIQYLTKEQIIEIIKQLPPEVIYEYLTEEQIKYIIKQQPPEVIFQTITIIGIEYVIFSGNQVLYNENAAEGASSSIGQAERDTNNKNVQIVAQSMLENPDYLLILHGHANPTKSPGDPDYQEDLDDCIYISNTRAKNVASKLEEIYDAGHGGIYPSKRVTTSGYGGEKNLVSGSTLYAGLNRRVEMILFRIEEKNKRQL